MHQLPPSLTLLAAACVASGIAAAPSSTSAQGAAAAVPAVTLPNTEAHVLRSQISGDAYAIYVAFPFDYNSVQRRDTRYPTLYVLDAGGEFPIFRSMIGRLGFEPSAELIVVGIERVEGQRQRRSREYTPPASGDSVLENARDREGNLRYGGAGNFLRILREEIIPFVERTYRTNGDRGIHGHSFGGLFVAYAMLEAPELFSRYLMTSPSLYWGGDMLLKREPAFAKQHPAFAKRVYISVGSAEDPGMVRAAWQFASQLCTSLSRGSYKGIELTAESIAGEPHESYVHHVRAMRAVYAADSTQPRARGVMRYCGS